MYQLFRIGHPDNLQLHHFGKYSGKASNRDLKIILLTQRKKDHYGNLQFFRHRQFPPRREEAGGALPKCLPGLFVTFLKKQI
jgi:hypothetical protein